jgi:AcrR family transcriptional regulator
MPPVVSRLVTSSRGNKQGVETRKRLIKIAERMFAEQGVDAVSIRAVNAAADLGAASVHYHFGSKERLLEAVILDQGQRVVGRVEERAAELAARDEPATTVELVEIIAMPFLHLLQTQRTRGLRWVKVVAQLTLADDPMLNRMTEQSSAAVLEQVHRSFPDVDPDRLRLRWNVAGQTLIQMLSQADHWMAREGRSGKEALEHYVAELVNFVAGGVEAIRAEEAAAKGAKGRPRRARA